MKTSKLKLVILDANVVIYLHEITLWPTALARCDVHLSRVVAEHEVRFATSSAKTRVYRSKSFSSASA